MRGFLLLVLAGAMATAQAAIEARVVARGFDAPIFATAPAGDARLFVAEQGGAIRILNPDTGAVRGTPFLTVPNLVAGGEQGLLGLAFHPNYATNGYLYVNVTRASDGATEIRRYQVSGDDPNRADVSSGTVILTYAQPFANHNGGWLGFGPDGFLYIAAGDGGSGNDPGNRAQNPNALLGKMLRIDVDHPSGGRAYGIPPGNPFATGGGAPEVWDYGLRNPWRNSFDRETGDLWIGDVGQGAREEIDVHRAGEAGGKNYGWRVFEGGIRTPGISDTDPGGTVGPVVDYPHSLGQAVTGGYVCRFAGAGDLAGLYIYGDFVSGRVWTFRPVNGVATDRRERTTEITPERGIPSLASFAEDGAGRVYAVSLEGAIYRIVGGNHPRPKVRLTGPSRRTTEASRLRLRGTTTSQDPVERVIYRRAGEKKFRVATGKKHWTAAVRLARGTNRVTIEAVTTTGSRSKPLRVVILRR